MDFEIWYLILVPVLFCAGWFARSFDIKEKKGIADETQTLYKGLDLLLSNKQDQAIDSFIDLVRIDPDTIEMHHSLGSLFRKRGEYARAIKIHNHLSNRADLPKAERARALFELGKDYLKAGIWDRAENCFRDVSDTDNPYRTEAVRQLINIYESEKEWLKAIDEAHVLESRTNETYPARISHLYCEQSLQCMMFKDFENAKKYLESAITADPENKRALIMLGKMQKQGGDLEGAIATWRKVGQISPQYETLVVEPITRALIEAGKKEDALRYVLSVAEKANNSDELDKAIELIAQIDGSERALEILRRHLKGHPSLIGFLRLVELRSQIEPDNGDLKEMFKLLKAQVEKTSRYKCSKCGFVTRKFQWQCPGCRNWDSFSPVRHDEPLRK